MRARRTKAIIRELEEKVISDWNADIPSGTIARKHNCDKKTVSNIIFTARKRGLPVKYRIPQDG